jgi:AraC-like DNA-binding protein
MDLLPTIYLTRRPAPPLDLAVSALWYYRTAPRPFALERVLPKGAAQLVINLKDDQTRVYDPGRGGVATTSPGAVLTGPGTHFEVIDTDEQEHVVGVSFRPGGTRPFFRLPADALTGPDVPLECLWSVTDVALLREQLLAATTPDAALDVMQAALTAAWRDQPMHRAVDAALATFHRESEVARVAEVADAVGLSVRRFIEAFARDVGLTPKQYCRVRRFQQAVTAAHAAREVDWAEVALSCGFYDQAHFIHDFRAFSGLTPGAYRDGRTVFQNHVTFLQSPAG